MMTNTNFDRGAALEILRYTAKIAAAPAIGGQAGTPAAQPGPLNPTGGATQGGSNNPQMQTGWAAGAMRKSLIKRFTANASNQQKQPVNAAASRQVGGMGTGMPKTGMAKLAEMEKEAIWPWLARGGVAAWNAIRGGAAATRAAAGARGASVAQRYRAFRQARAAQAALRAEQAAAAGAGAEAQIASKIINPRTMKPFEQTTTALGRTPKGSAAYTEPVRSGVGQRLFGRGTGLKNVYKHKDTGKLITGPRGFFAKGRAPSGYKLHKPWTRTGGYLTAAAKRGVSWGLKGGATGYGLSYPLNTGKWGTWKDAKETLLDPRRLSMAAGGATLGASFSSLPALAASMHPTPYNLMAKGMAGATNLAKSRGGLFDATRPRGGSYLDILKGVGSGRRSKELKKTWERIKDLEKLDSKKRLGAALKESEGKRTVHATRRQFKLDEGLKSTRGRRGAGAPKPGSALARAALAKSKKSRGVAQGGGGVRAEVPKAGVIVGNRVV